MSKFYTAIQNNSGGYFMLNKEDGIGDGDANETPAIYGEPLDKFNSSLSRDVCYIHRLDGSIEEKILSKAQ